MTTFSVSRSHFFSSPFPHHTLSHLFSPFTRCLFFFFLLPFSSSHVTSSFFFFLCRGPSPSPFHFAAAHPLPPSSFPSTATHPFPLFGTPMRPPPFADMSILCFFWLFLVCLFCFLLLYLLLLVCESSNILLLERERKSKKHIFFINVQIFRDLVKDPIVHARDIAKSFIERSSKN